MANGGADIAGERMRAFGGGGQTARREKYGGTAQGVGAKPDQAAGGSVQSVGVQGGTRHTAAHGGESAAGD